MNRNSIMEILDSCAKVFPPSTKKEQLREWIVVKFQNQQPSISSTKGGWQYVDIMCYVDKNSILPLDRLMQKSKLALKSAGAELTGVETPDFYDSELEAFMRSFQIRIPKEVN